MTVRNRDERDPVAQDAATWFVRLNGEGATGDDWLVFEGWLAASPANREAYAQLERLWVELDAAAPRLAEALAGPIAERRPAPLGRWAWSFAGAALAAGIAVAALVGVRAGGPAAVPYQTRPGEIREIALADGSRIRLNAASDLSVRLGAHTREVAMAEGEAVFDVAHDAARPFLIRVGDRQVRVVGTQFDLRHRDGALTLTVRRGVVEVRPVDAPAAAPVRLHVSQQLTHRDGQRDDAVAGVDADEAFDWAAGQLVYRDQPIAAVAADLSRRFGEPIRPADAETGKMRFTGVLVTDSEPAVLRRLEAFSGVTAERTSGGVLLHRPSRR